MYSCLLLLTDAKYSYLHDVWVGVFRANSKGVLDEEAAALPQDDHNTSERSGRQIAPFPCETEEAVWPGLEFGGCKNFHLQSVLGTIRYTLCTIHHTLYTCSPSSVQYDIHYTLYTCSPSSVMLVISVIVPCRHIRHTLATLLLLLAYSRYLLPPQAN
jgi:hypothetical protein